jgi:NAD(P)-dependent dehydrogenase (short-subunit alcohol dehydrogenase family)
MTLREKERTTSQDGKVIYTARTHTTGGAAKGIRVNAVSPGVVKTPMHAAETHEFLAALHPMKHMGEIRDIVDAVLYLESAGFVTGEILHVDGGQSAGH